MIVFISGIVSSFTILAGICGFNIWIFNLMEKRIEAKIDSLGSDISKIAQELRDERISKDALYKFVLDNYKK
jgi:hypothetical protein